MGPFGMAGGAAGAGGLASLLGGPLGIALLGGQALGGLFGGIANSRNQAADRRFQGEQFAHKKAMDNAQLNRQRMHDPLKDQAQYILGARMGLPTEQFRPNDMFNPQAPGAPPPQQGGVDMEELKRKLMQYMTGAGGIVNAQGRSNF